MVLTTMAIFGIIIIALNEILTIAQRDPEPMSYLGSLWCPSKFDNKVMKDE